MTPKKAIKDSRELESSQNKGSLRLSHAKKRQAIQFNPALYITRQLTETDILLIKEAFDFHDYHKMGLLTPNDLKQALFQQNFYASKETIYNLIAEYDEQGLGGLNFDAFVRIINSQPACNENTDDLRKIFRKYDRDHKGYISVQDLISVARALGQTMSDLQIQQLFLKIDVKKEGKIGFEDFCKILHHPDSLT